MFYVHLSTFVVNKHLHMMIHAVITGRSVIGKQTKGRFNFARAILANVRFDR